MLTPSDLLDTLTLDQLQAVTHLGGPCLVIAGAGTGKTTVITKRIAHLILVAGIKPETIVALTFTDKAAREMTERVDEILPYGITNTTIATFHRFCADLIKRHAFLLGLDPQSQLLSSADEISFLRQHLDQLPTSFYKPSHNPVEFLRSLSQFISKARDEYLSPEQIISTAQAQQDRAQTPAEAEEAAKIKELGTLYKIVQDLYRQNSLLSYADLIYYSVELLSNYPSAQREEQEKCRYLLIDEFQDTNTIQSKLANLLVADTRNIFVVGDDDQAIYSFRGANIANILEFSNVYPERTVITLVDNFRSSQPILDAAYRLIQNNNPERLEIKESISKKLISHHSSQEEPHYLHFAEGITEVQTIAGTIQELISTHNYAAEDIAILVRSKNQVRPLVTALEEKGVVSQFSGDLHFFTLPVVQSVLAYLRFLSDSENDLSLFYLLSQPPFQIAENELQQYSSAARYQNSTLFKLLLETAEETLSLSLKVALAYLKNKQNQGSLGTPSAVLLDFLHSSGWYLKISETGDQAILDTLATLYQEVLGFEQIHRPTTVREYVRHFDFLIATDEEITLQTDNELYRQGVQIMTIHKSKGLEFKTVFIPNMIQGKFPSRNYRDSLPSPVSLFQIGSEDNLAEERRLAYVAITRAKEKLYLTFSSHYLERKTKSKVSPFVNEASGQQEERIAIPSSPIATLQLVQPVKDSPQPKIQSRQLSYSPSALETYQTCPLRYKFQYVNRIKIVNSHLSNFGTSIHETLRQWGSALQEGRPADLAAIYQEAWISGGYENKSHELERYAYGLENIQAYVQQIPEGTIQGLEISVQANLPSGALLRGKIDRLDRLNTNLVKIIDYKTGENPKKPSQLVSDITLGSYLLAIQQQGSAADTVELHYVMTGTIISVESDKINAAALHEQAQEIINQIEESTVTNNFPAKPDKISCQYCDYRSICPFRYGKL